MNYAQFAFASFKITKTYAEQALAILNHSPELLEDAKNGLAEAYYAAQAKERQRESGKEYGKGQESKVVELFPQPKARDEAGKAAGVSARVDIRTDSGTKEEMNVGEIKGVTLGKLAEAYGISRSALDRMRINYVIYPEDLFSPAVVFYKLLKGRSTELRTRLACIEERKRIRKIINSHIK